MHTRTAPAGRVALGGGLGAIVVIVFLLVILMAPRPARADDLDDAMASYIHAIREHDPYGVLRLLSTDRPWRFFSYRAGTSNVVTTTSFTYAETQQEFLMKQGLYFAFFVGTDAYRYSDRMSHYPLSAWTRSMNSYRLPAYVGTSFVNWTQEDGRWVIQTIADDSP